MMTPISLYLRPASSHQKMWDLQRNQARADTLLSHANDPVTRARLLAVSVRRSPISSLGLRMDDKTVRVAIGLSLGSRHCQPHVCVQYGLDVDELPTHGFSCRRSPAVGGVRADFLGMVSSTISSTGH